MKYSLIWGLALLVTCPAWAINKCTVDGKAVFQDAPCGLEAKKSETVKVWDSKLTDGGGKVRIGMTEDEVIRAWGKPDHVNKTITSSGTRKQLVFGTSSKRQYLYIDDGVLTSIQTPE